MKSASVLLVLVIAALLSSGAIAETTTQFVNADDEAQSRGIVGYVVVDYDENESVTYVVASELSGTIAGTRLVGCMQLTANVGSEELSLRFTTNGVTQFVQSGTVVAEVSPDGAGGWNHWGTNTLAASKVYEALLLASRDANLAAVSTCDEWGYWRCVGKVLLCEAYSLACAGTAIAVVPTCAAACDGPQLVTRACIGCIISVPGVIAAVCLQAWDCWTEAYDRGCVW
jgi:hypothetical protein